MILWDPGLCVDVCAWPVLTRMNGLSLSHPPLRTVTAENGNSDALAPDGADCLKTGFERSRRAVGYSATFHAPFYSPSQNQIHNSNEPWHVRDHPCSQSACGPDLANHSALRAHVRRYPNEIRLRLQRHPQYIAPRTAARGNGLRPWPPMNSTGDYWDGPDLQQASHAKQDLQASSSNLRYPPRQIRQRRPMAQAGIDLLTLFCPPPN
jgi:hypothetical protein